MARIGNTLIPVVAVVLAACSTPTQDLPTQAVGVVTPATERLVLQASGATDPSRTALSRQFPGFGGFDISGGALVMLVTDSATAEKARANVVSTLRQLDARLYRQALRGLSTKIVRHSFAELTAWQDKVLHSSIGRTMHFIGVDDARNRLLVGVQVGRASEASTLLVSQGIPVEAFSVVELPQILPAVSLRDRVRPAAAGFEMGTWDGGLLGFSGGTCTITDFVTLLSDTAGRYLLTNSHCTARMFAYDGSAAYQAMFPYAADSIGVEVADPALFSGGACPSGFQCRYSDAALFKLSDVSVWDRGRLALTNLNSNTVTGYSYMSESGNFGTTGVYYKTGNTSGTTSGFLRAGCMNQHLDSASYAAKGLIIPSNVLLLCQDVYSMELDDGDSGSPVYEADEYSGLGAPIIDGIAHSGYGSASTGWWTFVSRLSGVYWDIGPINFSH